MLLTFILIIISIPSPPHSFIPGLKPSFSANPSHRSLPFLLRDWLHGFPGLFTDTFEYIRFLLFLFSTVYTHCASVHQAAKLVAAILRVAGVTAGLTESNGSLPPGLWLTSPASWLSRTGISSGTLRSVIEYGLHFYCLVVGSVR